MKYAVAAIEDGIVCLENDKKEILKVSHKLLPADVMEGDILDFDGNVYTINKEATKNRRKSVYEKYRNLFNK